MCKGPEVGSMPCKWPKEGLRAKNTEGAGESGQDEAEGRRDCARQSLWHWVNAPGSTGSHCKLWGVAGMSTP